MSKLKRHIDATSNSVAKRLLTIIEKKKSNMALSADKNKAAEILQLADQLGPSLCILKTHIDIVDDFSFDFIQQLKVLAHKHQFLIFEDRKFADIGNTVRHQFTQGVFRIAEWADIVNIHAIAGSASIEALRESAIANECALLLLAQLSSQGNLIDEHYTAEAVRFAKAYQDVVIGFISQQQVSDDEVFLHLTPGVKLEQGKDDMGQRYRDPRQAIVDQGNDIIIVGRGIIENQDPLTTCQRYQQAAWDAYTDV